MDACNKVERYVKWAGERLVVFRCTCGVLASMARKPPIKSGGRSLTGCGCGGGFEWVVGLHGEVVILVGVSWHGCGVGG